MAKPTPPKRVNKWSDLPDATNGDWYLIENEGREPSEKFIKKNRQRVLEGLIQRPIFSASIARISEQVSKLRNDCDVQIHTEYFEGKDGNKFGVYFLESTVQPKSRDEAAA